MDGNNDDGTDDEKLINDNETFPIPVIRRPKYGGWDFYTKVLRSPKLVVAPMVDQSELAWRMLCRRHGAELCYTPMYHSNIFIQDVKYRQNALQSCPEDRPLIIQFCGNDPNILLEAGLLAQDHCDAIDINLGCPQAIAKRGHYGSFLQDEWELLHEIVNTLHTRLAVPLTCKIRIFDDLEKTIKYAQMLEKAGCQLLTVHGRTREQKGPLTGIANWSYIKAVREHIKIPMFANGNILSMEDIDRCIEETGVNGVMTAEGNLNNPMLFERIISPGWDVADEYLEMVERYPCPASYIRGHMFKIFHHLLNLKCCEDLREAMAVAHSVTEFRTVLTDIRTLFQPYHDGLQKWSDDSGTYNLSLPPWLCQPHIRMEPDEHKKVMADKVRIADDPENIKRKYFDTDGQKISRKLMKKLRRVNRRPNKQLTAEQHQSKSDRRLELCGSGDCVNPMGLKCEYKLCRVCCRRNCAENKMECTGHRFFSYSKRLVRNANHSVDEPLSIVVN